MNYQKIFIVFLFTSILLAVFFGVYKIYLEPNPENYKGIDSVRYSYTVEEGNNFTLVSLSGVLGEKIDDVSSSGLYEFYFEGANNTLIPLIIDLGDNEDLLGTYETTTLEDGSITSNFVYLTVREIINSLNPGEVEIQAMTDLIPDVNNLCVAESCDILIESAEKNKASNIDDFLGKILAGKIIREPPQYNLRITFIAEKI